MANNPEIKLICDSATIELQVPIISSGKFRCKIRTDIQSFGKGLAPSSNPIPENAYIEWQIGYDTVKGNGEKNTILKSDNFIFVGANGKKKYPYELSELLFLMCKKGIFNQNDIENLHNKIEKTTDFLADKYLINAKKEEDISLNDVKFKSSSTTLPTFITETDGCDLLIEIMIQKQQYATGVQPMLYLIAPISAFSNSFEIIGNTSKQVPFGIIEIDENYKELVEKLFVCFGMCSKSHRHDVIEILKTLIKNVFNK